MKSLSVIIVNYRTPALVVQCLNSFYTEQPNFEVIIVDNNSGDDSRERICAEHPGVTWLQMSYNAGFARANNEGIRRSTNDTVLLLNSDTIDTGGAIPGAFTDFMQSDYVACGVQLLNRDMTPQISGNYFMKGGLNFLLPIPGTGYLVQKLGYLLKVKKPNVPDANTAIEVDWINGAFLMIKKQVLPKAGLMDEDFFLYAEEAEWCSRIRRYGRLCIFGQYKVIHLQGETAKDTFQSADSGYRNLYNRMGLQFMLSNFLRIRKQYGIAWLAVHLLVFTVSIPLVIFIAAFGRIFSRVPVISLQKAWGYTRNVASLWSFMPKMIANKPYFYKVL